MGCARQAQVCLLKGIARNEAVPYTTFEGLAEDPIYTLGTEVPQAWLVRPHWSPYDLDNIHLASLSGPARSKGVEAVFRLDYLVIEGHARETATVQPPRGLQLELTSARETTPIADTQVVANLGYMQLKAKPGVFKLDIRPGRGREIYTMESVGNEGWNSPPVSEAGNDITVTSFEGLTLYPRFVRNAGMEEADVLTAPEPEKPSSFMGNIVNQ